MQLAAITTPAEPPAQTRRAGGSAVDIPQINAGRTNIMNYTFTEENNYLQRVASAAAKS